MELTNTIELMASSDYKDRFRAEYYQLVTRLRKLVETITMYETGELDFEPTCPIDVLRDQVASMRNYQAVLQHRAMLENISLEVI